jgi:DNA-binding transcriptional MerR regulator
MVGSFDEQDSNEELGYKSKTIKSLLYKQHDPHHVAEQQTHLSTSQRQELAQLLAHFP